MTGEVTGVPPEANPPTTETTGSPFSLPATFVTTTKEMESSKDPRTGMAFSSYEEVYHFYEEFGKREGFAIRVKSSAKRKDDRFRRVMLTCRKADKGSDRPRYRLKPSAKTDCQARVVAKLRDDGLLHLVEVVTEHNHPISPSQVPAFRRNTSLPLGLKKQIGCDGEPPARRIKKSKRLELEEGDVARSCKFDLEPVSDVATDELERYDCLTRRCLQLAKLAALSEDKFHLAMKLLGEMETQLLDVGCVQLNDGRIVENDESFATSKQVVPESNKILESLPPGERKESKIERSSKLRKKASRKTTEVVGQSDLLWSKGRSSDNHSETSNEDNVPEKRNSEQILGNQLIESNDSMLFQHQIQPMYLPYGSYYQSQVNSPQSTYWILPT